MRSNFQSEACHQLLSSNHYFTGKKRELCRRVATFAPAAVTRGMGVFSRMQPGYKSGSHAGVVTCAGTCAVLRHRDTLCGWIPPFSRGEYEQ